MHSNEDPTQPKINNFFKIPIYPLTIIGSNHAYAEEPEKCVSEKRICDKQQYNLG